MKKTTINIGLAVLILSCSVSACSLLMPTGSYVAPRQDTNFVHLYTSRFPAETEWDLNKDLQLRQAIFDHSSPVDQPLVYLFPDNVSEGQFLSMHPDSVQVIQPNAFWNFNTQSVFSDNGSGFLASGWYDSDAEGPLPSENGIYRFLETGTEPANLLVSEAALYASSSIGGKFIGLTWHPDGPAVPSGGYQALWAAGETIAIEYSSTGTFPSVNPVGNFPDAISNIDTLFTRLNSTNWPNTSFWNTSTTSLDNFGYAPSSELYWLQASRFSPSTGENETWAYIFSPAGGGISFGIDTERVAGRAGPFVLIQGKPYGETTAYNTHYFAAVSAAGVIKEFEVYGQSAAYLGEQETSSGIRLLFVSISQLYEENFSRKSAYYFSVYALPLEVLAAGE
ncbi:MAG: hypothetical protein KKI09_04485 [Spirochaetes bacterium]|nr:hypothetical protein [Spirochaetota bacterium]MBU0954668.1 hypothetical protein [Spirochaetota bacterium]